MEFSKRDLGCFKAAKAVSEMSDYPKVHIGCVVTNGHRIISSGFNSRRSHPLQKRLNKERFSADSTHLLHAESAALIPLLGKDIDWKKCNIYIYREYKDGQKALARPCPSCQKLIRELGIRHIYYTGNDSYVYENLS